MKGKGLKGALARAMSRANTVTQKHPSDWSVDDVMASKDDEFCITNEELCIKKEESFIRNDEFCRNGRRGAI